MHEEMSKTTASCAKIGPNAQIGAANRPRGIVNISCQGTSRYLIAATESVCGYIVKFLTRFCIFDKKSGRKFCCLRRFASEKFAYYCGHKFFIVMTKYVNILNDDAFKVVIFTPGNEELLARMIEIVIPGMHIKQLVFQPTEQHGLAISDKISNFDAVCTSESGEMFIVEMQCLPQESYADRMLCYASFPIRMQLERKLKEIHDGRRRPMDYSLMPIYVLSFINFRIGHEDDGILQEGLVSSYKICSPKTGEVMTDALYFGFVELGRLEVPFGRPEQCKTVAEQLAYSMKYMNRLSECPKEFEDRLFPLLFRASAYANMNVKQQQEVTHIMRTELDRIAENEYARKQGVKEGREKEREAMAQKMKERGMDKETIFDITGIRI